ISIICPTVIIASNICRPRAYACERDLRSNEIKRRITAYSTQISIAEQTPESHTVIGGSIGNYLQLCTLTACEIGINGQDINPNATRFSLPLIYRTAEIGSNCKFAVTSRGALRLNAE